MKFLIAIVLVVLGAVLADEDDGGLPPLPPMTDAPPPPPPSVPPPPPPPPSTDPPPPPPQTDTPAPPQTDAPPPPPTQGPPPPTAAPDCKDKAFNCQGHLKKYCKTSWNIKYTWCRKTCGACEEGDCKDRVNNCFRLQKFCNRAAVAIMCQRTCKVCS
ncbi:uncharacterized proline-rich protein-like [Actinia tenebrosa]|uniref:Uncharacterized proline-rich protein-like n=1 Tax=Actinia tenebrosa TaxID=6105 RepID=A0A6P8HTF9_ACTTE|nr:uncharacterized proline-rich protein-like [Actinia tenebrosa]